MIEATRTCYGYSMTWEWVGGRAATMVPYPRLARFNYLQRPKTPLVCILRRNQGGGGVVKQPTLNTRCAWAGGTCANLIFSRIISFMLFTVLRSGMYFFRRISHIVDSWFWRIVDRICWACAIFRWTPNLQVCTDGQTDRQTDGRINPGWAGLPIRFLQVHVLEQKCHEEVPQEFWHLRSFWEVTVNSPKFTL
jgi:hypothetical protein